ncbi:uncharacterized protein [Ambystoma mexicanum]|uniref:uncharacterized protein n=1 Tax=Ambystoma mexicanum TaxID=8296 RepID=UPI0037E8408F
MPRNSRGRLKSPGCCRRSVNDYEKVPPMKILQRIDGETMVHILDNCALRNSDETILSCCRILGAANKLNPLQRRAILRSMLTTITAREVTRSSMTLAANALDRLLKDSEDVSELEQMALMCEVALAKGVPEAVSLSIINLFTVPAIPEEIVFWAIQQLTFLHGPEIAPHLGLILSSFIPIMKNATTVSQKIWFSLVVEILAGEFVLQIEASLGTLFFDAYSACKAYITETIDASLPQVCGPVMTTLGNLVSILTTEQIDMDLSWVAKEVERLQRSVPPDLSFDLIKAPRTIQAQQITTPSSQPSGDTTDPKICIWPRFFQI